jgi:hypothetical protein
MTIDRRTITTVVVALTVWGAYTSRSVGQEASESRNQLPAIIKYDGDMASMLSHLPSIYGATIGLEVDPEQPRSQVGFDLRDPTLTDVLDAIVQSAPRYQWHNSGGFIEVSPLQGSCALLDTIISNFRVDDVDEREAINQLVSVPEVQASMRAMRLNRQDLGDAGVAKKGEKISISLENVTMRQALNIVAKQTGTRFWIFSRHGKGSFSISNAPR